MKTIMLLDALLLRGSKIVLGFGMAFVLLGSPAILRAQTPGQTVFESAAEAVDGLIVAVNSQGQAELSAILGAEGNDVLSSGDDVADEASRKWFAEAYRTKHSLLSVGNKKRQLVVGKDDWALPIPIVEAGGKWYFDTATGKQEIVYRRIGHNELGAISVCKGYVAAQEDYAAVGHDELPAGLYAARLISEPGKQNGLYWDSKEGAPASPIGPPLAKAAAEGYSTDVPGTPYHGYLYRSLKAQGNSAKGGAMSYVVDNRLEKGFALVAYPAQYRVSGVMTFLVNQRGAVYQKDLGDDTGKLAAEITEYNPDSTWSRTQ